MFKRISVLALFVFFVIILTGTIFAEPKYGGTLIWGRGGDSVGLDPICETDGESFKVTQQIFDTLVEYEPGTTNIKPALATSWSVSEDGLTWTFKLRKGVKFHDGTPFNAEAVKFNFDRWRLKDHPYHIPGEFKYYGWMFGDDLPGVIQDVVVIDDYTIQFVLKQKFATFLANLAMVPFGISSPTAIKKWGDDYFTHPVGTGPFKFVEWIKGDRIILEANEDYWDGRPYLDKIVFRSIPDNGARFMELQAGTVDIIDGVSPNDVEILKKTKGLKLVLRPSMNIGYFGLNQRFEPLKNVLVRRAICHAIDKEAIIEAFYAGLAIPAKNVLPPSLWGYNDEIEDYEYNPAKAKELLAEAGYPDGFEMELWAMPVPRPYMPQPKLIAQAIQQYLAEVGIKTKIVTYDWGTYLDKSREGLADSYLLGWTGDNGDPDNFIYVLLDKTNNDRHAYVNDELHEILVKAQQIFDQEERAALYKKAQVIIHNDAPFVFLVHSTPPLGLKENIEGYIPSPTGSEKLNTVWKR
ncbi:peptide ABC transporter substrate-binding protein [Anoxybacter fermentans]|uniref:Peptide ABC transporter substrate-binding protein n=1 Tax=Anoxybacter fermentans TaxID=1323375 RepID=A0A3S9T1R2_9FIRM|nr:ABC transporter substrate-binding protein [Anoxybacter fermentans]AZR74469.1 peptide ABC transporter substrate-binding protein [Anoxybacter fermentans]